MNTETIHENVLRHLGESRGKLREISDAVDVPYSTLVKIHQGVIKNPGVNHIQALYDYFNGIEREVVAG